MTNHEDRCDEATPDPVEEHRIPKKSEEGAIAKLLLSISQNFQHGFVDVGANLKAELARPFIEQNWNTLLIEPQPHCAANLRVLYADFANVRILQCGCSFEPGELKLYLGVNKESTEVATFSSRDDPWMNIVRSDDAIAVPVDTLTAILCREAFPNEFGILKIDTESWDYNVLRGLNFNEFRPAAIVTEEYLWDVESTIAKHLMLEENGYVNIHRRHGARWSALVLRDWLSDIGRYPTAMGGAKETTLGRPPLSEN